MIDIVPLQNNFKEFRDFVLDDFIRKQLDNTINYLVDYLELPYAYIFLSQEDETFYKKLKTKTSTKSSLFKPKKHPTAQDGSHQKATFAAAWHNPIFRRWHYKPFR